MHIAYVYDAVLPWETGGVQRRVWELAKRLADHHDVSWYGLKYWDGPSTIEREGVTIHGIAPEQELYVDGRRSIREALSFSSRLLPSLLGADHDVIDCQEFPYFPVFASKASSMLHDTTLCVTWHEIWGDYWYDYLGRKGGVGKAVEYLCGRLADEQIAVSKRTRRDLEGIGVEGARLVPNGIDAAAIQSVSEADEDVDVVFAARLIEEKNPDLLIQAIERLVETRPEIRCRIVGEGPERARVDRLVEQCGVSDNVSVTGFLDDRDDVLVESHLAHYVDADVCIVLRCQPAVLEERLTERGEPEPKAVENAESEALDVILAEAVDAFGEDSVYEIDTTDRTPEEVAREIEAVLAGDRDPSAGDVDFTDYL